MTKVRHAGARPAPLAFTAARSTARSRDVDRAEAIRALCGGQSVVYACRLPDGTIKIGWSGQLDKRRRYIASGAEVLAFMPGDRKDESAIHNQLRDHLAHGREYYLPTVEVLSQVNQMRDRFNLPHLAA